MDPSGLGFFSFLKKIFREIAKILSNKWVLLIAGIVLGAFAGLGFYWAFALAPARSLSNHQSGCHWRLEGLELGVNRRRYGIQW